MNTEMQYPESFAFRREARLEQLKDLISFSVLGNPERRQLRKMAEEGQPIDLIARGLLAYSDELAYHQGRLDLTDPAQVIRGQDMSAERKCVEFTISLIERLLSPVPAASPVEKAK